MKICNNNDFWRRRFEKNFGPDDNMGKTWKQFYIEIVAASDRDDYDDTPLNSGMLFGVDYNLPEVVMYFINKGADNWNDAFIISVEKGNIEMARFFLPRADLQSGAPYTTLLQKAFSSPIEKNDMNMFNFLYNEAGNPGYDSKIAWYAIIYGNEELARRFLDFQDPGIEILLNETIRMGMNDLAIYIYNNMDQSKSLAEFALEEANKYKNQNLSRYFRNERRKYQ